jgi:hypothetical protein
MDDSLFSNSKDAIFEIKNNLKSIFFVIINCILRLWIQQRKHLLYTDTKVTVNY